MLSSVIIGGGPGGLGPIIWAAQHGLLPAWLDRGVAVVERQAHLGGTLGRFGIKSDSLGGSYLECLEAASLRRWKPAPSRRFRFSSTAAKPCASTRGPGSILNGLVKHVR